MNHNEESIQKKLSKSYFLLVAILLLVTVAFVLPAQLNELNDSLENVSVSLGYTGVETSDYQKDADDGKTFCLIKMSIEKDGSKESIDWAKMKVTDSEGNEYERMSDEFLTDLGMKRMPGNTLNFGSNEGWIAFEVNDDAEGLELSYSFESEEYHCTL